MKRRDRMDALVTTAVRQGFAVRQNPSGSWTFMIDGLTVTAKGTPKEPREWVQLVQALRGAGLTFPAE